MPEPIRVVVAGTPESGVVEIARNLKKELGLPFTDFSGMSGEKITEELKRFNGDQDNVLFVVPMGCAPTMGTCTFFLCGSDATHDTNIEGFTHILYLGRMSKVDVVFLLRDTVWRKFPVLRKTY